MIARQQNQKKYIEVVKDSNTTKRKNIRNDQRRQQDNKMKKYIDVKKR